MAEIYKGTLMPEPPSSSCVRAKPCPYLVRENGKYFCSNPEGRTESREANTCKHLFDSITAPDAIIEPVKS